MATPFWPPSLDVAVGHAQEPGVRKVARGTLGIIHLVMQCREQNGEKKE